MTAAQNLNIRCANIILAVIIVLRHYFFYGEFGIDTEFGPIQPIYAYVLIPVTGMIGASFFWRSSQNLSVRAVTLLKIFILIIVSNLMSLYIFNIDENLFTYSAYEDSRRPVFLILVPILLALLLLTIMKEKIYKFIIMVFLIILYGYTSNFVLHYLCIFISIYLIAPYLIRKRIPVYYYVIIYVFCSLTYFIYFERLNILIELLWVISGLGIVNGIASTIRFNFFRFSILDFYVLQGIFFYSMRYLNVKVELWVPFVLFASFSGAWFVRKLQNDK